MPIHDYVCSKCGHAMEVMHSVHGHGPDVCPLCGGPMKKTLAAPSVHFKGTGWARKDRASGARVSQTSSKESAASSGGASGTGTDGGSDSAVAPAAGATPAPAKDRD